MSYVELLKQQYLIQWSPYLRYLTPPQSFQSRGSPWQRAWHHTTVPYLCSLCPRSKLKFLFPLDVRLQQRGLPGPPSRWTCSGIVTTRSPSSRVTCLPPPTSTVDSTWGPPLLPVSRCDFLILKVPHGKRTDHQETQRNSNILLIKPSQSASPNLELG